MTVPQDQDGIKRNSEPLREGNLMYFNPISEGENWFYSEQFAILNLYNSDLKV